MHLGRSLTPVFVYAVALAACEPDPPAGPPDGGATEDLATAPAADDLTAAPAPDLTGAPAPDLIDGGGGDIEGRPRSPLYGSIVFNEVLTDGTTDGDPNGDGDADPVEDQFVELVSVAGAAIPMGGFTLVEADLPDLPRHTFAAGFSLAPGRAVVVFGGGDAPPATASATFFVANAADPGLPFGLHLSTPADSMLLLDAQGAVVARFCYGASGECALQAATDESLTRSPDLTGAFVPHRTAAGAAGEAFSVGTRVDGSAF